MWIVPLRIQHLHFESSIKESCQLIFVLRNLSESLSTERTPLLIVEWIRRLLPQRRHPEKTERSERGALGERAAAKALKQAGYRIVARNWRAGHNEIDIVCRHGEILIFVEVRTRDKGALVGGYHSVTQRKKAALRRACMAYLNGLREKPAHFRFDIVEIKLCPHDQIVLTHHQNIPLFGKQH